MATDDNMFPISLPDSCMSAMKLHQACALAVLAIPKSKDPEKSLLLENIRAEFKKIEDDPQAFGIDAPGFWGFPIINDGPNYCVGDAQYDLVSELLAYAADVTKRSGELVPPPGPKWAQGLDNPITLIKKILDGTVKLTSDVLAELLKALWPILLTVGLVLIAVMFVQAKVKS